MLASLILRLTGGRPRAVQKVAPRWPTHRLEVEALEDRTVPVAIRNLPGFNANNLGRIDDAGSQQANLGFTANFFGSLNTQVFVNNNGNVSFGSEFTAFSPGDLTANLGGTAIIAAFFADVDTRNAASGVVTYGTDVLCGRPVFGVNYINVGYFSNNVDRLNSFQIILIDRSDTGAGNFDIELNYDQIQWESGDIESPTDNGLGGDSAFVGYSNGSGQPGTNFVLPGSQVPGSFLDGGPQSLVQTTLLSSTPGRLHFLVRNGQVVMTAPMAPVVNTEVTGQTRVLYPLRYIASLDGQTQRGNLTLINRSAPPPPGSVITSIDACLDIPVTSPTAPPSGAAFAGPITIVFSGLRPGVSLINQTGATASGLPYITVDVPSLPPTAPVLRAQIQLQNPFQDALSTFFIGFPVRVFAGPFDPSLL